MRVFIANDKVEQFESFLDKFGFLDNIDNVQEMDFHTIFDITGLIEPEISWIETEADFLNK